MHQDIKRKFEFNYIIKKNLSVIVIILFIKH